MSIKISLTWRIQVPQRTPRLTVDVQGVDVENCRRRFTAIDSVLIAVYLLDGWGIRAIALALGRSAGTISDEIRRHGGAGGYAAQTAHTQAAASLRLSGRKPRLAQDSALFRALCGLLRLGWSPEQICGRRKRMEEGMEQRSGLQVSHEAIYTALYALPRG